MIKILLSGSKSITNRLLIVNSLFNNRINLKNISKSQDSQLMGKALQSSDNLIDIHHAGTAMRFLTAYFSIQKDRNITLTGSKRMKERPISILVQALQELGADIAYLDNKGFPPLKITGKNLKNNNIKLSADTSSQYITALCLIGSKLKQGLLIELEGKITSFPYIKMTIEILKELGIQASFNKNIISISPAEDILKQDFIIESDWSSASYHYSICALGNNLEINIKHLFKNSLQADRKVADIYEKYFGINTEFMKDEIIISKIEDFNYPSFINLDMNDCPDIAQTVAVTSLGLGIPIKISGLETLKIKETDRLQALKNEIEKCGGKVNITNSTIEIIPAHTFNENVEIESYNDHRMAMCFAPLKLIFPLKIKNPEVVEKSYTEFWNDMKYYNISK